MCRYLIYLSHQLIRSLRFFLTKLPYNLLILKHRNYKPIITYLILVCFSTIILFYYQSNSDITWNLLPQSLIDDKEIIQVNNKRKKKFL